MWYVNGTGMSGDLVHGSDKVRGNLVYGWDRGLVRGRERDLDRYTRIRALSTPISII